MDVKDLLGGFMSSPNGQKALAALTSAGVPEGAAQSALGHATDAVANHLKGGAQQGIGNFMTAFASGLTKGEGIKGALEDGATGAVVGAVTGALVEKAGLDPAMASTAAAAATPYITSYLKEKI